MGQDKNDPSLFTGELGKCLAIKIGRGKGLNY